MLSSLPYCQKWKSSEFSFFLKILALPEIQISRSTQIAEPSKSRLCLPGHESVHPPPENSRIMSVLTVYQSGNFLRHTKQTALCRKSKRENTLSEEYFFPLLGLIL